jgi:hypothetical protein
MASNLTTCPSADVLLNQAPIFTEKLKTLDKAIVLGFGPPAIVNQIGALVRICGLGLSEQFRALIIVLVV